MSSPETYLAAFLCGGLLCLVGQILIDKTRLTPARILVLYVVVGVVLGAAGLYQPLVDRCGAGATVPLTGFGRRGGQSRGDGGGPGDLYRRRRRRCRGDCRCRVLRQSGGPLLPVQAEDLTPVAFSPPACYNEKRQTEEGSPW